MSVSQQITVIVPVSPIPSHPSTRIVEQAVNSVRAQLPDSPIEITCDVGTDPDVVLRLPTLFENCSVYVPNAARAHQSGMLAAAMEYVKTPLLLYFESDWELLPDVFWTELSRIILSGELNYIKLHATPRVSPFHEHLMLERVIYQNGIRYDRYMDNQPGAPTPIIKTKQWSQNPHLASTDFYRKKILPMCEGKVDFVENLVHGVAAHSPWEEFKCGIYNPAQGDMMRCRHLDGRGSL